MRENQMIQLLAKSDGFRSAAELANLFDVSVRTISNDIKLMNSTSVMDGFCIQFIKGKGYYLEVIEEKAFQQYLASLIEGTSSKILPADSRKISIALSLLFANDYLTIKQLSDRLEVSSSTIKKDMLSVKKIFEERELALYSKSHYGFKVIGLEENRRKAIIQLLRNEIIHPKLTSEYEKFRTFFDEEAFRNYIVDQIASLGIKMNDLVLENIVQHVALLVFRMKQHNFLKEEIFHNEKETTTIFTTLTERIVAYIEEKESIHFPMNEQKYLSKQLYGKIIAVDELAESDELFKYITQALKIVDSKYHTLFNQDTELKDALTLHVAPLLQRLYGGHQLENPIIEDVYTRYTNVFNIAYEFIQLIGNDLDFTISKDEMGYLAIYFAASLEKQTYAQMNQYKKIAVICATGGGSSFFVKTKLEQVFINAKVKTVSTMELHKIDETFDLIISTILIKQEFGSIPLIYTQALLSEKEIKKIQKDLLLVNENKTVENDINQQLLNLFSEENFEISEETDYLKLLIARGKRLEAGKFSKEGYAELVIQREKLIDTIYKNGVAGPHPMESRAIKECVDVVLLHTPIRFKEKEVKLLFLINISNEHLFLHKEISRLMIRIMEDSDLTRQLNKFKNYQDFSQYLREIIRKG